jgi:hypothetical protein
VSVLGSLLWSWCCKKPCVLHGFNLFAQKLYSYGGFEEYPSGHVQISNKNFEVKPLHTAIPTRPIYEKDVAELCSVDMNIVYDEMKAKTDPSKVYVSMIPDASVFKWHFAREKGEIKGQSGGDPEVHGAILGDKLGERAWLIWMRSYWEEKGFKDGNLLILRIVVEGGVGTPGADQKIGSLLCAAMREAADWKLEEMVHWNPRSAVVDAAKAWFPQESVEVIKQRTDDLNCFAWYGPEYDWRFKDVQSKDVVWEGAENWCWL